MLSANRRSIRNVQLGLFPEFSDRNVCLSLIRVNGKDCWNPTRRSPLFFVLEQRCAEITLGPIAKQRDDFAGRTEISRDLQRGGHVRAGRSADQQAELAVE